MAELTLTQNTSRWPRSNHVTHAIGFYDLIGQGHHKVWQG